MSDETLLTEFREAVYTSLIAKGVKPPAENSEAEQQMFEIWNKGRELLQGGKNE